MKAGSQSSHIFTYQYMRKYYLSAKFNTFKQKAGDGSPAPAQPGAPDMMLDVQNWDLLLDRFKVRQGTAMFRFDQIEKP